VPSTDDHQFFRVGSLWSLQRAAVCRPPQRFLALSSHLYVVLARGLRGCVVRARICGSNHKRFPEPRNADTMVLTEFRIPLPLEVDEFQVAQLYMVVKASKVIKRGRSVKSFG